MATKDTMQIFEKNLSHPDELSRRGERTRPSIALHFICIFDPTCLWYISHGCPRPVGRPKCARKSPMLSFRYIVSIWISWRCRNGMERYSIIITHLFIFLLLFKYCIYIQALVTQVPEADISAQNLVVRFSESVDGFPLPVGYSRNPELNATPKPGAEAFLASPATTSSSTTN